MTLRILFTIAILAGMAAAPAAQTFRWEPGNHNRTIADRVERALDQARRTIERNLRSAERALDLRLRAAERIASRRAATVERQVRARVNAQVRSQVRREVHYNRALAGRIDRGFTYGDNAGA